MWSAFPENRETFSENMSKYLEKSPNSIGNSIEFGEAAQTFPHISEISQNFPKNEEIERNVGKHLEIFGKFSEF